MAVLDPMSVPKELRTGVLVLPPNRCVCGGPLMNQMLPSGVMSIVPTDHGAPWGTPKVLPPFLGWIRSSMSCEFANRMLIKNDSIDIITPA